MLISWRNACGSVWISPSFSLTPSRSRKCLSLSGDKHSTRSAGRHLFVTRPSPSRMTTCKLPFLMMTFRAPCERFAPWVTPGPRITRFRLAADLGRMGLDTHRVSNKVSMITSRHLVPLDRAFPAHALVHESSRARTMPPDRILIGRGEMTRVGRGRSSDSGSHSRGRPHSPAQLDSGREGHRR